MTETPHVGGPDDNTCYACDGSGLASQGWSGNPSQDGTTCPDCRGTGIDQTPYGTGRPALPQIGVSA